ncbi:50S ribosomal protein L4 [Candidatus Dojkabacteria bacterium]|jgi:large subunit ribosomal protein L4|nr:50S ribosomal protein L4 [Candidatus Dojkabacteria bacterium]
MATKKILTKKEEIKETKLKLDPAVWQVPNNADLIAQVLMVMRSNARQANAHAKTRADVSGGGKKPWKQKGTGRARAGSNRSPLWNKGGVTFVPNLRNWERKINRKMRRLALKVMLSVRLREEALTFVDIKVEKALAETRKKLLGAVDLRSKTLIVTNSPEVVKAMGNVQKVVIVDPTQLNAMSIVSAKNIMIDKNVVNVIENSLTNGK